MQTRYRWHNIVTHSVLTIIPHHELYAVMGEGRGGNYGAGCDFLLGEGLDLLSWESGSYRKGESCMPSVTRKVQLIGEKARFTSTRLLLILIRIAVTTTRSDVRRGTVMARARVSAAVSHDSDDVIVVLHSELIVRAAWRSRNFPLSGAIEKVRRSPAKRTKFVWREGYRFLQKSHFRLQNINGLSCTHTCLRVEA